MKKRAILSVSFGTNDVGTAKRNIDVLEAEYGVDHTGLPVYRAVTNDAVIEIINSTDGIAPVYAVREAMAKMVLEGVTHLYVQPTYILNGTEYDDLKDMIFSHKADFVSVKCGAPLLNSQLDLERVVQAFSKEYDDLAEDEAVVAVGHGSPHYGNSIYCALDYVAKDMGVKLYLATFKAFPKIDNAVKRLKADGIRKIRLVPFMFVAGTSAMEGVCGDGDASIYSKLKEAGFEVETKRRCLGEYPGIREIYRSHLNDCFD